ncbi:MAG: hypothetical protein H6742_20585 [Alphaproteobacteria bacterium]|nr:hypothetical protein [Alphaproteobacteria bacterium]
MRSPRPSLSLSALALGLALPAALALAPAGASSPEPRGDVYSLAVEEAPRLGREDRAIDVTTVGYGPAGGIQHGDSGRTPAQAREAGIAWLEAAQLPSGGWGAGTFGQAQGTEADVATTAMAVTALVRDGGVKGPHKARIERGVRFIVAAVDNAPKDSPQLRTPTGTQPQGKLGQLVDTHMAALVLGEVAGQLPPELDREVQVALDTVIGKVQLAQRADGSFDGNGWAPVLSNSIAAMSLVQAQEKGVAVAPEVIERADRWQDGLYDETAGAFGAEGSAGVGLYSVASNMRMDKEQRDRGVVGAGKAEAKAREMVSGSSADALISGFGSVGGEEMLSYMMISDTLAENADEGHIQEWEQWDGKIGGWLSSIQNTDGSWAGHHCITSRTFVTATALITLGAGEHAGRSQAAAPRKAPSAGGDMILGAAGFGLKR